MAWLEERSALRLDARESPKVPTIYMAECHGLCMVYSENPVLCDHCGGHTFPPLVARIDLESHKLMLFDHFGTAAGAAWPLSGGTVGVGCKAPFGGDGRRGLQGPFRGGWS